MEKSKMMEYIYEEYNVFHGLFTEDLYNTLLKFHNTIINYERFDRVINHIASEKRMKYEEVVRALEDELSEKCGFSLHFSSLFIRLIPFITSTRSNAFVTLLTPMSFLFSNVIVE